ncbi:MAG TPA: alpha/beta fold hydrolase [Crenotrichaceae bacterium]|nr:alpha/beta fold hydrolase [Crenotrichaceae bacterium]
MQTVELNARTFGDNNNPPLIILHGLFGSSRNWTQLAGKWSEHYHVHVVDLRNHGESPHHQIMNYQVMAADVLGYMNSQRIQAASVLGHSMGGKVAMWMVLSHPDRVQSLIVIDIAPVDYANHFTQIFKALKHVPLQEITSRQQAENSMQEYIQEPLVRQFLLQNMVNREGHYRWRIPLDYIEAAISSIIAFPAINHLQPYTKPVMFIRGGQSCYLETQHHQKIKLLFPVATITTIENAGHWVHVEQPQQVLDLFYHFLQQQIE